MHKTDIVVLISAADLVPFNKTSAQINRFVVISLHHANLLCSRKKSFLLFWED